MGIEQSMSHSVVKLKLCIPHRVLALHVYECVSLYRKLMMFVENSSINILFMCPSGIGVCMRACLCAHLYSHGHASK